MFLIGLTIGACIGIFFMGLLQINKIKDYEEEIGCMQSEYHRYAVRIANLENIIDQFEKGIEPEYLKKKRELEKMIEKNKKHIPEIN